MSYIILICIIVFLLFLSEFLAFCWHKWGAHEHIIPDMIGVQKTHEQHHTVIGDQAYGDFFYILLFLIAYFFVVMYLVQKEVISNSLAFAIYAPVLVVSFWSYFVHTAYHIENHWLNKYSWFRNDKRIHFQHHRNPSTNYGIATHFSDVLFDTFDYGLLKEI